MSVVVPKMLVITLTGDHSISSASGFIQSYVYSLLGAYDSCLSCHTSLDRSWQTADLSTMRPNWCWPPGQLDPSGSFALPSSRPAYLPVSPPLLAKLLR